MLARNESLEKSMTDKADVIALLTTSLNAVRTAYAGSSDAESERPEMFGTENSTVRRLYMRTVCHLHEHMGQLIAYTRAMGLPVPWLGEHDTWRKAVEEKLAASKK